MLKNKSKDTIKAFTIAMILALDNKNYNKEQLKKNEQIRFIESARMFKK